jgi:hypothetical protein
LKEGTLLLKNIETFFVSLRNDLAFMIPEILFGNLLLKKHASAE